MNTKLEKIRQKFGNKIIGSRGMKELILEVVSTLPDDTAYFVAENVWFVNSFEDAWGFVIRGDELKGKFLVFLADELFRQEEIDQRYEIAHEIGHIVLKHRNAISAPQSKAEIARQEREADAFARQYLKI
jgi:hypothetical protein